MNYFEGTCSYIYPLSRGNHLLRKKLPCKYRYFNDYDMIHVIRERIASLRGGLSKFLSVYCITNATRARREKSKTDTLIIKSCLLVRESVLQGKLHWSATDTPSSSESSLVNLCMSSIKNYFEVTTILSLLCRSKVTTGATSPKHRRSEFKFGKILFMAFPPKWRINQLRNRPSALVKLVLER